MSEARPRTVLVTGGARGIGRATALLAGARGWSVAIGCRADADMARRTADEVRAAGGSACAVRGDVGNEDDVARIFDEAEAALGPLDAVVVNAGIVAPSMPLSGMDLARLRLVIDTNLVGALLCAREAARRLPRPMEAPPAALVFLSSVAARLGAPSEYVDYAATKGAIDTLTLGLAKELARDNIRVNAVRPGLIDTDIHASGGCPDRARELAPQVPFGRPGSAREVAEAIVWLCSDAASYTSGAILDVSGGR